MTKPFNWKIFFIVWIAAVFGVVAVIPYTLTLQGTVLQELDLPIPLPLLLAIQIGQNAVMFAVLTALGLFFANRIGLGLPILEAKLAGESVAEKVRAILPLPSIIIGAVAAVLIIAIGCVRLPTCAIE
jgi:hypothetical protein